MARLHGGASGDVRSSALRGTGNRRGVHRSNAFRRRRGRGILVAALVSLSLVLPLSAGADEIPDATILQQGRGEVNLVRALATTKPANPNAALSRFVVADPNGGGLAFDADAFYTAVTTDASWDAAAWQDAAWQDAAWQDAAWADSATYADNADGEGDGSEALLTAEAQQELAADPELDPEGTP